MAGEHRPAQRGSNTREARLPHSCSATAGHQALSPATIPPLRPLPPHPRTGPSGLSCWGASARSSEGQPISSQDPSRSTGQAHPGPRPQPTRWSCHQRRRKVLGLSPAPPAGGQGVNSCKGLTKCTIYKLACLYTSQRGYRSRSKAKGTQCASISLPGKGSRE